VHYCCLQATFAVSVAATEAGSEARPRFELMTTRADVAVVAAKVQSTRYSK
jgi:hypothetical protein